MSEFADQCELQPSPELMQMANWGTAVVSGAALRNDSREQKASFQSPAQLICQPINGNSREVKVKATGMFLPMFVTCLMWPRLLWLCSAVKFGFVGCCFFTCRQPASSLCWTALCCSAFFDLRQTAASQIATRGRLQMPGPRTDTFPPQATGEGAQQGTGRELRAGQR